MIDYKTCDGILMWLFAYPVVNSVYEQSEPIISSLFLAALIWPGIFVQSAGCDVNTYGLKMCMAYLTIIICLCLSKYNTSVYLWTRGHTTKKGRNLTWFVITGAGCTSCYPDLHEKYEFISVQLLSLHSSNNLVTGYKVMLDQLWQEG